MKIATTLLVLCISTISLAQSIINKEVGDFSELKVYDLIEVNMIPSNENKVVIKGEDTHFVKVVNKDGKLKIKMELERIFNGEETFVEVHFKNIDIVDANEGAYIVANEMIEQNTIDLRAQEGGRIKIGMEVGHVKIRAVTGGVIDVSGIAKSQEIKLMTGGVFEGRELKTQDATVKVTAAGQAQVNASESIDVRITAGGDVYIYGDPKNIKKNRVAGGRIKVMN